jgi:hypothetical protein
VAAEHETLQLRVVGRHSPDEEPKIESRTLPRNPSERAAENLTGQPLAMPCRSNRDDGIRVHVIDMAVGAEGMQGRVDARGPRIQVERAVRKVRWHLAFVIAAAKEPGESAQLFQGQRREPVQLGRPEIAARALDPEHLERLTRERVGCCEFRRGVPASEVGQTAV